MPKRFREEWNPYSQRILLPDWQPPAQSEFEKNFKEIIPYTATFIEWAHEAMHLLAVEPFFVGYQKLSSKKKFVQSNLANEGLGFWYADIIISSRLRDLTPQAEIYYGRSAVSNMTFHPSEAFKDLGIKNKNEILRIYCRAFLNRSNPLKSSQSPYSKNLASNFRHFYKVATNGIENLFAILTDYEFFDAFYVRFCKIENLPSLFTKQILQETEDMDAEEFAYRTGVKYLPSLELLGREVIKAVCFRRQIQTRAYSAWFIYKALMKDAVYCLESDINKNLVLKNLDKYLSSLENLLHSLAKMESLNSILIKLKKQDVFYDQYIRREFLKTNSIMKYRFKVYPLFQPTRGVVGMSEDSSGFTKAQMLAIVQHIMEKFDWNWEYKCTKDQSITKLFDHFLTSARSNNLTKIKSSFNSLLVHPRMLRIWSARLGEIQPSKNRFQELIFEFS